MPAPFRSCLLWTSGARSLPSVNTGVHCLSAWCFLWLSSTHLPATHRAAGTRLLLPDPASSPPACFLPCGLSQGGVFSVAFREDSVGKARGPFELHLCRVALSEDWQVVNADLGVWGGDQWVPPAGRCSELGKHSALIPQQPRSLLRAPPWVGSLSQSR